MGDSGFEPLTSAMRIVRLVYQTVALVTNSCVCVSYPKPVLYVEYQSVTLRCNQSISKNKLRQIGESPIMVNLATIYGGDRGIRTPDLCDANAALSQLSYIPTSTLEIIAYTSLFIKD